LRRVRLGELQWHIVGQALVVAQNQRMRSGQRGRTSGRRGGSPAAARRSPWGAGQSRAVEPATGRQAETTARGRPPQARGWPTTGAPASVFPVVPALGSAPPTTSAGAVVPPRRRQRNARPARAPHRLAGNSRSTRRHARANAWSGRRLAVGSASALWRAAQEESGPSWWERWQDSPTRRWCSRAACWRAVCR
jgi:hypothetical protein